MARDYVLEYMKKLKQKHPELPWTRETYLSLAYWDSEKELGPEEGAELPEEFQLDSLEQMPVDTKWVQ
jgi:hypothetical protein